MFQQFLAYASLTSGRQLRSKQVYEQVRSQTLTTHGLAFLQEGVHFNNFDSSSRYFGMFFSNFLKRAWKYMSKQEQW